MRDPNTLGDFIIVTLLIALLIGILRNLMG